MPQRDRLGRPALGLWAAGGSKSATVTFPLCREPDIHFNVRSVACNCFDRCGINAGCQASSTGERFASTGRKSLGPSRDLQRRGCPQKVAEYRCTYVKLAERLEQRARGTDTRCTRCPGQSRDNASGVSTFLEGRVMNRKSGEIKSDQRHLDILRRGQDDAAEHIATSREAIERSLALLQLIDKKAEQRPRRKARRASRQEE